MSGEAWAFAGSAVAAIATIVVAVIEARASKDRKRHEKGMQAAECRSLERQKRREKESRLSMEMMSASLDLAYVTSLAVTGGHTNGNVEAAQKKAKDAQDAYNNFLRDEAAHAVAKV